MAWNVAITMEPHGGEYQEIQTYVKDLGFNMFYRPDLTRKPEDTIRRLKDIDAVIAGGDPFTTEVIEALKGKLKMISRYGVGIDQIDIKKATQSGIPVTNTPGMLSNQVAEMAVGLLLNVNRGICRFDVKLKEGHWWQGFTGNELEGKTVGLVGFGQIAQKFAKYLCGFDCRLIAYDLYFNEKIAQQLNVEQVSLDYLTKSSDVISLHVPINNETRNLVNKAFLNKMKKSAVLINTSRGAVVNEKDLIEALTNKVIAGAGLDVFELEPPAKDNPLLKLENVVLTPHTASHTQEGVFRVGKMATDAIYDFYCGKVPGNIINPDYIKYLK